MSEAIKTVVYVVLALFVALIAYVSRPQTGGFLPPDAIGKPLCPEFTDATVATSLTVVTPNNTMNLVEEFTVSKNSTTGVWTIPSKEDYPADAEDRLRDSIVGFLAANCEILDVFDPDKIVKKENATDEEKADPHKAYGVKEPSLDQGGDQEGTGTLIRINDDEGKALVHVVIGKEVKEQSGQRYVRNIGSDFVYAVELDLSNISGEFSDWIEDDLLNMNAFDLEEVTIKDYTFLVVGNQPQFDPRMEVTVNWNQTDSKWELGKMLEYRRTGPEETNLLPGEELNTENLNSLKTALGDLKIVDVKRKPDELGSDLKLMGEGKQFEKMRAQASFRSLEERGFYLVEINNGSPELISANGEVIVGMKDGIEYVLRFGNNVAKLTSSEDGLSRYLFVRARFNPDRLPAPTPISIPPRPEGLDAAPEPSPEAPKPGTPSPEAPSPEAPSPEAPSPEAPTPKTPAPETPAPESPEAPAPGTDATTEGDKGPQGEAGQDADDTNAPAKSQDDDEAADPPVSTDQPKSTEPENTDAEPTGDEPADKGDANSDKPTVDQDAILAEWEAERDRITRDNEAAQKKWEETVLAAKKRVKELNFRFAPWYYQVSDSEFKKVRLGRDDLIKEGKEALDQGFGVDSLRQLQEQGLNKQPAGN